MSCRVLPAGVAGRAGAGAAADVLPDQAGRDLVLQHGPHPTAVVQDLENTRRTLQPGEQPSRVKLGEWKRLIQAVELAGHV